MTERLFPIMALSSYRARDDVFALRQAGATQVVIGLPWSLITPHEEQARSNHGGQTLERLAERGGLGPDEAVAVLENRRWHRMESAAAHAALAGMIARWRAGQAEKLDGVRHAKAIEAALREGTTA